MFNFIKFFLFGNDSKNKRESARVNRLKKSLKIAQDQIIDAQNQAINEIQEWKKLSLTSSNERHKLRRYIMKTKGIDTWDDKIISEIEEVLKK